MQDANAGFFLSILPYKNKLKSCVTKPPEGSLVIQLCQKSPQNVIKFRARSKLLRYRLDNCTNIALKSQLVFTRDFKVSASARQNCIEVAATKIACVNGP